MEDRKKPDFKKEFATNFVTLFSKETNSLEKTLHSSYDKLWKKFLTLAEKSRLCKVNQFKRSDRLENTNVINNYHDKDNNKKFEKLIESFQLVKFSQHTENKQDKIIFRSEQKIQTYYKSNDLTKSVKAKKNLNFANKTKDYEFKLGIHPPLASSSILVPKESEKIYSSPKHETKNSINYFSSKILFYFYQIIKNRIIFFIKENLNNSGKVKQIVEMVEARMKDSNQTKSSIASKLVKSNSQVKNF